MALPLTTAAVALFYAGAIPLQIALCLRFNAGVSFGAGFALFVPQTALRHARRHLDWTPAPEGVDRSPFEKLRLLRFLWKYLRGHLHWEGLLLYGALGTGDAASTALLCGSLQALGRALGPKVRVDLKPDFSAGVLRGELSGMISVRVGHIILAVILGFIKYSIGRLTPWNDIPSRAS